nr:PAS domain-containing protein [Gammaproteobacteria bacterium]NIN61502.1 PAS domain-containing protein [Gammaproteobacteria bacterium]NIO61269.1 PAS domain-containing protein [Gammaproteobacteria bacterium]NIQ19271.1 PAS domain-containing protein [Gammaproteobacteria bacterium]NIT05331.1 PAS domain-containing protein [Gammaproteobacteria bacterium]
LNMWGLPDDFVETRPTIADVINYNRHNNIYDVPESEFDAYIATRVEEVEKGDFPPYERHLKDGRIIRYQGIALPDGGRMLNYFDITELKQRELEAKKAEATIKAAHSRLNHILAFSPTVVYSVEATGDNTPTFVSENIRDLFGYEPSEYLDDRNFVPKRIHPDDAARVNENLKHLFKEGHMVNEYRFLHKDGTYRVVSDDIRVIKNEAGEPVEIAGSWSDISARKQVNENIVGLLQATSLFGSLDEAALRDIAADAHPVQLMGGMQLIKQGDSADSFYLVMGGRIRTFITQDDGYERQTGEIGRGELIGDTAILTGELQPVSARAIRDTDLLQFSKETFYRLAESNPEAILLFSKNIAIRYQKEVRGSNVASAISNIAIIPAGQDVSISEFSKRLVASLSQIGSTLHLDVNSTEHALSQGSANSSEEDRLLKWLHEQETKFQFVIYESTLNPSSWSRRCTRQADLILSIGTAGGAPDLNSIEKEIASQQNNQAIARQELVLLHPNRKKLPSGTKKWLDIRSLDDHHHVVLDSTDDYKRLSRLLTGNAVGLVLGGGGARGCAHIGLIRALRELDVPIDAIGGTSIGSIVASAHALGFNSDEMLANIDNIAHESDPIKDITLPIVSLMTGGKLNKGLQKMYGDVQIEDLWVKYYAVSANMTRAQTEVHKRGPVWKSVRMSMSIPGQIPPVVFNGELHVDGGVLNNLPVDVMREICDGIIIANNVSPRIELNVDGASETTHSGWFYMLNALNPFSKKVGLPNILNTLMRSGMLSSIQAINTSKAIADIYLSPPIDNFQLLEFRSAHEIEEVGYKYALKEMSKQIQDNILLKSAII